MESSLETPLQKKKFTRDPQQQISKGIKKESANLKFYQ